MAETASKLPIQRSSRGTMPTPGFFSPFDRLSREIDRLFDGFGLVPSRSLFDDVGWPSQRSWTLSPAVDVAEKDDAYEISAELPGLDEKNIEIKVANGMLTIKGEKQDSTEERKKDYYLSERRYGSFMRSFQLPDGVDPDKIDATFSKGVLTLTLPKSQDARKNEKRIEVKAA